MNKEIDAQSGEGVINKPGGRFELIEIKRYESKVLRATIQDAEEEREGADDLDSTLRAKIVNTGINRYIEFEEHLQGFKNGEILEYRTCQDGTAMMIRKHVSGGNNGKKGNRKNTKKEKKRLGGSMAGFL